MLWPDIRQSILLTILSTILVSILNGNINAWPHTINTIFVLEQKLWENPDFHQLAINTNFQKTLIHMLHKIPNSIVNNTGCVMPALQLQNISLEIFQWQNMISIKKALEWNTIEQNFPFSSSVLPYAISAINHTPLFTPTSLIIQFIHLQVYSSTMNCYFYYL